MPNIGLVRIERNMDQVTLREARRAVLEGYGGNWFGEMCGERITLEFLDTEMELVMFVSQDSPQAPHPDDRPNWTIWQLDETWGIDELLRGLYERPKHWEAERLASTHASTIAAPTTQARDAAEGSKPLRLLSYLLPRGMREALVGDLGEDRVEMLAAGTPLIVVYFLLAWHVVLAVLCTVFSRMGLLIASMMTILGGRQ